MNALKAVRISSLSWGKIEEWRNKILDATKTHWGMLLHAKDEVSRSDSLIVRQILGRKSQEDKRNKNTISREATCQIWGLWVKNHDCTRVCKIYKTRCLTSYLVILTWHLSIMTCYHVILACYLFILMDILSCHHDMLSCHPDILSCCPDMSSCLPDMSSCHPDILTFSSWNLILSIQRC
jgi:hypothetical protein